MKVPVYTNNLTVFNDIKTAGADIRTPLNFSRVKCAEEKRKEGMYVLLPFLSIIDVSSLHVDFDTFINATTDDLMHYRKVMILIVGEEEYEKRKEYFQRYQFVISIIRESDIKERFVGVLTLFKDNPHLLINMEMQALTSKSVTNKFILYQMHQAIPLLCNVVLRLIRRLGFLEEDSAEHLHIALLELLINAAEHGNCGISFQDKHDWLKTHSDVYGLVEQRWQDPRFKDRYSTLEIGIFPKHIHFQIADMGEGFDWRAFQNQDSESVKFPHQHGYGIRMARQYTKNLTYNNTGNTVSFDIPINEKKIKTDYPQYFSRNNQRVTLQENEVLVDEGENYALHDEEYKIYFIVDGELKVFADKKQVGTVSADDVFCGELGYLLQTQRGATVIAATATQLIELSAAEFTRLVRHNDFCLFLLMRMLATRLESANTLVAT